MALFIFDKDGTICQHRDGPDKFINSIEDQVLMPGVADKIAVLKADGHKVAIASNQGGVAWGYMTYHQARAIVAHAARLIRADTWLLCPHHPDAPDEKYGIHCRCRKPLPGMLLDLSVDERMRVDDIADIVFVGDMETDQQAAEAAGVRFEWAAEFFQPAN